jgi:GNAT superfamily N-acetyltransferase/DNA-binding MarR family transcriptional regulator
MKTYQELGHVTLGTALRQLAELVSQDAENTYANFNFKIDPKWFPVFYVLASKESDSVVNIAKEIQQSHVSVSKIVKEMKADNLINSHKSPKDSRVTLIALNNRARAMIPAMEKQCEAVDKVMNQLTKDTGINLFEALQVTQRHLKYFNLSSRIATKNDQNKINIVDYAPIYQTKFKELNVEWISQYWALEEPDYKAINDPEGYILNQGGVVFIALYDDEVVGCCALIKINEYTYELAKMAVSPKAQGKMIGTMLGEKIIHRAKLLGAKRLYLESNSVLKPAINLYLKLGFTYLKESNSPYERCNVQMELFL